MSSTRTAKPGRPLKQGKFSSSAEFNRGVLANLCANRCALLASADDRELIWFIQYLSHQPGGLEATVDTLIEKYGTRFGTRHMLQFGCQPDQLYTAEQVKRVRREIESSENHFPLKRETRIRRDFILEITCNEDNAWMREQKKADEAAAEKYPDQYPAADFLAVCQEEIKSDQLARWLAEFCLDPQKPADCGPWYFHALVDCLREYHAEWNAAHRARQVVTELGSLVEETLDYTLESRRMTLIDGLARTGKTFSAKAWCSQRPGRVRFVEVPSTNDEIAFYRAIAKALGVTSRLTAKAQELRLRIEETLQSGQLGLVLDEAHYLWPNQIDSRSLPSRVNWIMTALVNKGVALCLITTPQFLKNQRALENRTRWTSEQFIGRIGHYQKLPDSLSEADLAKVAQALLPEGEAKAIELLVCYAKGSAKYLAGLDAVVARARYLARKQQRDQVQVGDLKAAIRESVIPSDSALALALAEPPKRGGRGTLKADYTPLNHPFTGTQMSTGEASEPAPASPRGGIISARSEPASLARDGIAAPELISG